MQEGKITKDEILTAIDILAYNKAPGDDGFLAEFYKCTKGEVVDSYAAYKEAENIGNLTALSNRALITVLLKVGKDRLLCSSYHQIALLNRGVKIVVSILATSLKRV